MTGEKNRYKTHEQLWKLEDGDLSTPQHDELVLQLLNHKNCFKLLSFVSHISEWEISEEYPNIISKELVEAVKYNETNDEILLKEMIYNEFNMNTFPIIKSEVPVTTGNNKFIIGYIDVQFVIPIEAIWEVDSGIKNSNIFGEYKIFKKIIAHNNPLKIQYTLKYDSYSSGYISYVDRSLTEFGEKKDIKWTKQILINIEVKPKIKSFGETLRQINTYRECNPNALYILYSPDARFKDAFETQGVKLITPNDIGINI